MSLEQFIFDYFVKPIYSGEGYNIYNTVVYSLGLIAALAIVMKGFKRLKIGLDKGLFWLALPYILLGGMVRALADLAASAGMPKHFMLITPGIYFMIFFIAFGTLLLCKVYSKDWLKNARDLGWSYVVMCLILLQFAASAVSVEARPDYLLGIVTVAVLLSAAVMFVLKRTKHFSRENSLIVLGQMLDAGASSIAVAFLGYGEQHVVTGALMDIGSPFVFIPVKMVLVVAAIWAIEKYGETREWQWLLKIAVLTLGLAPGTRNVLRIFMGV